MIRITELAQEQVARVLREGDLAVDATAGKGRDTLFLARQVGPQGRVYAFDVQREALEKTAALLKGNGLLDRVTLIDEGHESMADHIDAPVAAVMFNLGYLPGGDPTVVTRPETTRRALEASLNLLRPGGAVALALYGGHIRGGGREGGDPRLLQKPGGIGLRGYPDPVAEPQRKPAGAGGGGEIPEAFRGPGG